MNPLARTLLAALLLAAAPAPLLSQETARGDLEEFLGGRGRLEELLAGPAANALAATFQIRIGDGTGRILATCIDRRGYLVTKASELEGAKFAVEIPGRGDAGATLVKEDASLDLALVKVESKDLDLPPVVLSPTELKAGQWIASPRDARGTIRAGVLSVGPRRLGLPPSRGAFLGVTLEDAEPGARIARVEEASAADVHGLKTGDVVIAVDGQDVGDAEEFISAIRIREPDTTILVRIQRLDQVEEIEVKLGRRAGGPGEAQPRRRLGAQPTTSRRATGFPLAFQHDANLQHYQIGGPVVDRLGRVVGINIARASRTAVLAIPAAAVNEFLAGALPE